MYPYHTIELVAIFVYGNDFTRHMSVPLIPDYILTLAGLISLFVCFAAIILWIIRRKYALRRNDSTSSFMDALVPFIGGGNARIKHKCEKWFFGILLIGAFLITSLFTDDLLDCVYQILNQKLTHFEQLTAMNLTGTISPSLSTDAYLIYGMLKKV